MCVKSLRCNNYQGLCGCICRGENVVENARSSGCRWSLTAWILAASSWTTTPCLIEISTCYVNIFVNIFVLSNKKMPFCCDVNCAVSMALLQFHLHEVKIYFFISLWCAATMYWIGILTIWMWFEHLIVSLFLLGAQLPPLLQKQPQSPWSCVLKTMSWVNFASGKPVKWATFVFITSR